MNFAEVLKTLESQNCRLQDKEIAYQAVLNDFQSEVTHEGDESLRAESQRLLKLLSQDVLLNAENVVNICLEVLHHCLKISYFRSSQNSDSAQLLQALIRCAQKTQSVDVTPLVDMVEAVNAKAKAQSRSILEETVNMFHKFDEQISEELKPFCKRWARFILPGLVTVSDVTRERCFNVLMRYKAELCQAPDLSKHLTKAITSEFHKGPSINSMLEIIEIGFKGNSEAKCQAFIAWRSLISNFGLDKNVISDPKRIKLLMMVFKYDNAKTEPVAVEKMLTWWHFVVQIGPKLMHNFEKVVYPMLQFCVGNSKILLSQPSKTALKPSATNLPNKVLSLEPPAFPAVQKLGLEAVALLLSSVNDVRKITWNLEPVSSEVFEGSTTFAKHATVLLNATHQIFKNLKKDLDESLVVYTWTTLTCLIKRTLENSTKSELRDILSTFLTDLHNMVELNIFEGETLFKMAEACSTFPVKVLASTAFNVRSTLRGSPALLLSEVLLSPAVMKASSSSEGYLKLFAFLVDAGANNKQGALEFLQTVSDVLDCNASSLNSAEQLWKMWDTVAHTLQETVIASNEVNQGDALEYNFGCMHAVLLLPVKQQLANKVPETALKALIKTWKELYHSFARLSALVTTAEANACLEEICCKILKLEIEYKKPSDLECLASLANKMLDCVDFSAFATSQGPSAILTLSPRKWARRRQKPMGNLHSYVHLLETLQKNVNTLIFSEEEQENQQSNPSSVIFTANMLVDLYIRLFAHINTPALIFNCLSTLAEPVSRLFKNNAPCNIQRLFVPIFLVKVVLEKLWHEISLCIGGRYSEPYNSELLSSLSPLFEVTFLHSRRAIKNQAVALWNTTFSRALTLEYPVTLKPVLSRVKEKMSIVLPSWIDPEDIPIIAESPFSEMSMGMDSQIVPPPVLPSMPSPKRPRASMLNKDASPVATKNLSPPPGKSSPAKILTPKEARKLFSPTVSRNNIVDLMPEEEFVVINSPATKKKRLLTEHQKEVLKEKSVLPAMYNNLDASQDVSLMSQFGTETQNESSMTSDVIVINSSNSQDQEKKSNQPSAMLPPKFTEKPQPVRSSRRLFERTQSKESDKIEKEEMDNLDDPSGAKISENKVSKCTMELDCSKQKDRSLSPKENPTADGKEESPFVMFRQNAAESLISGMSKDSQVGVKSREAQNEDSLPNSDKKSKLPHEKEPRRVSLKTLDSPAAKNNNQTSTSLNSPCTGFKKNNEAGCRASCDGKRALTEEKSPNGPLKEQDSQVEKHANDSSVSNVLTSGLAQPIQTQSGNGNTELQYETKVASETDNSVTLVEDTQSPDFKKQGSRQNSQSITETPTKSDDSLSPHLRSTSARKLFVDDPPKRSDMSFIDKSSALGNQPLEADDVPLNPVHSDEAVSSSQGFEPVETTTQEKSKLQDIYTMFGFSQLMGEEAKDPSPSVETDHSQRPVVEDGKENDASEESENFVPSLMPTMATSNNTHSSLASSKSSESSPKTQVSSSDASSEKNSSSPEADFFPQQSTFQENSSSKDVLNKRKRTSPKKFNPSEKKRGRPLKNKHKQLHGNESSESNNETMQKSTRISESCSQEHGEVTPDIKSPTSATPVRGHSSTKRKRKISVEASENPKARKSISPEVDKEASELEFQEKQNTFHLAKVALKQERRKVASSNLTKSSGSKHMLRTRHKSSPPKKLRKLSGGGQIEADEVNKDVSLPLPNEEEATEENTMESDSDDDMPLVKLKTRPADKMSVSANQDKAASEDNQEHNPVTSAAVLEIESALPLPRSECSTPTKNVFDKAIMSNKTSVESSPSFSEKSFSVVDEVLSSVLSKMVQEMSSQENETINKQAPVAAEEFTPLLLSEDVQENMSKQLEESQDHLQAGQCKDGLQLNNEEPAGDSPVEQALSLEKQNLTETLSTKETVLVANCLQEGEQTVCNDASGSVIQGKSSKDDQDMEVSESSSPAAAIEREAQNNCSENALQTEHVQGVPTQEGSTASEHNSTDPNKMPLLPLESDVENAERRKTSETKSVLHDWSPSKSPSFSILKKASGQTPSPGRNRVSFAEPVVNGESPVREKYHIESISTSPLISRSSNQRKGTPFARDDEDDGYDVDDNDFYEGNDDDGDDDVDDDDDGYYDYNDHDDDEDDDDDGDDEDEDNDDDDNDDDDDDDDNYDVDYDDDDYEDNDDAAAADDGYYDYNDHDDDGDDDDDGGYDDDDDDDEEGDNDEYDDDDDDDGYYDSIDQGDDGDDDDDGGYDDDDDDDDDGYYDYNDHDDEDDDDDDDDEDDDDDDGDNYDVDYDDDDDYEDNDDAAAVDDADDNEDGRVSGYKRRLGHSMKQMRLLQGPENLPASPTKSPSQSPSHYKATQESQLDSKNPIFADLVDCTKPVDDILPQLTSSLWYRGLHHMMKGRSLNTIGDLACLTEVQVSQLPIRHPKIDTVRNSLKNYMAQHGLFKPIIKLNNPEVTNTPTSNGATLDEAVTPSSIADEGIEIQAHDDDLDRLSPIEGIEPEPCLNPAHSSRSSQDTTRRKSPESVASSETIQTSEPGLVSILTGLADEVGNGGVLQTLDTLQLFEVHQKLNGLFAAVVEEMKNRHSQNS
ncbi:telomere-associated protein RIF1-like [Elysia marginata]|uniref:Telomere-associated protein RIF1-like n=1 Tax=Elysia marginata TaxID=1093978 RepID=A0AAV4HHS8_9GAST|nr:telomere-associated protein RIF1-like [Elysia marginata]